MKEIKNKIVRYSTAVGALLAIAPAANAAPVRGTLLPGDDGNTTLTHDEDFVGIDLNNDGFPDFYAVMYSSTDLSPNPFDATLIKGILLFAYTGNYIEMPASSTFSTTTSSSSFFVSGVKKFLPGEKIGPLNNPSNIGLLAMYSNGLPQEPPAKPTAPFGLGDSGFIGVSMSDGVDNNYGWIQVSLEPNVDLQVIDCALERIVAIPISAGATVPLLPIASALGIGLVGLAAYAKGRKKKQTI
jgi:hypothetical protein